VLTFPPGNGVSLRRKYFSRGGMSRKTPPNQEKPQPQRENVLETTPKPGGTAAAEGKCPGKHRNTGRCAAAKGKCPGKRYNSGRKCLAERKMSRKPPQNKEKPPPQGAEGAQMKKKRHPN
jgi:hypothetical protein